MRRAVLALLLAACGGGSSDPDAAAAADDGAAASADAAAGEPSFGEAAAYVHVIESPYRKGDVIGVFAGVTARFRAAALAPYTEVAAAGDCRLYEGSWGLCDPPCDGWCDAGGVCHPFPAARSAGTLTIDGLAVPVAIEPAFGNAYDFSRNDRLFVAGSPVEASAAGAEVGGFALAAPAVDLFFLDTTGLALAAGADLVFTWERGAPGDRIHLTLNSDTAGHGMIHPALIECDAPDTGSLTVPQALIDPFVDPANWGCGDCATSRMRRYRRAVTTVDGVAVELVTASETSLYLVPNR